MAEIYRRQYETPTEWQNLPSEDTPLDAEHLNKLDEGIKRVDAELSAALTYCYNRLGRPVLQEG
jgi:hypothetical protein